MVPEDEAKPSNNGKRKPAPELVDETLENPALRRPQQRNRQVETAERPRWSRVWLEHTPTTSGSAT